MLIKVLHLAGIHIFLRCIGLQFFIYGKVLHYIQEVPKLQTGYILKLHS
jgi:hypothetical protein